MAASSSSTVIRLWASVCWADGVLGQREATALGRLIDAATLDADERSEALGWLERPVTIDQAELVGLSENQRLLAYRAALRLAVVDLELAEAEREVLDRLRDRLGLSLEMARELEAELPAHD